MKCNYLLIIFSFFLTACNSGQNLESKDGFAVVPAAGSNEAVATYGGGCFWAMQECMISLKGVNKVISGYAGGSKANPSYEQVVSGKTGHAESVQVYYDPEVITFEKLTEAFFNAHDPTQVDRQGPDIGTDYRSIAFYRSKKEQMIIQTEINKLDSLNGYITPVATEVVAFKAFYPAETHHQDYYKRNTWDPYIRNVSRPKVMKIRKMMPEWIKPEYAN